MTLWKVTLIAVAITSRGAHVAAQALPATVAESYLRARSQLEEAIAAHGGLTALNAARHVTIRMTGTDHLRNQSRRVGPPYDSEPWTGELTADLPRNRLIWTTTSHFPGGFNNGTRTIIDGPRGLFVNFVQRVHVVMANPSVESQRAVLRRIPHLVLLEALSSAAGLRYLGRQRLSSGVLVDVITTSTPSGALTLGIDPTSHLLRAIIDVVADPLAGDATAEVEFTAYSTVGRLQMPGLRISRVAGEVVQRTHYDLTVLTPVIPDSLLSPPTGSQEFKAGPAPDPVRALAPGVWAIRSSGYWSLAVEFANYVVVVEAPAGAAADVIQQMTALVPGKSIRYVAVTHHHDDHAGGLKAYMAAGATVVTTPGNRAFFERMAQARSTLRTDSSATATVAAHIEVIQGHARTFSDGVRTLELHDIGPSPHAEEMVVAWLPAEGIVFEGDLFGASPNGTVLPGGPLETMEQFATWIQGRGWDVHTIVGVHGLPGTMVQLYEAIRLARTP